jgi:hypothetical protein
MRHTMLKLLTGLACLLLAATHLGTAQYPDCNWRCTSCGAWQWVHSR